MGRSNCNVPTTNYLTGATLLPSQQNTFLCDGSPGWVTREGWFELLRQFVTAADIEGAQTWTVLWLYIPDFTKQGQMNTIVNIP